MSERTSADHAFEEADALVVYATTHGHTATIADRIGAALRSAGLEVDVRDVAALARVPAAGAR
ncbi:MAG: flavodoxin domain-containing protein [Solirubrobacteraceae bacterium]|nr:flavodoxin domain-containing protein [Solirubrobacteraceae bacterium]